MSEGNSSLDVHSRIASFEAHNDATRRIPDSPTRSNAGTPETLSAASSGKSELVDVILSNLNSLHQQSELSPDRPPSTTRRASQNRKNRLREANIQRDFRAPQPPPDPPMVNMSPSAKQAMRKCRPDGNESDKVTEKPSSEAPSTAAADNGTPKRRGILPNAPISPARPNETTPKTASLAQPLQKTSHDVGSAKKATPSLRMQPNLTTSRSDRRIELQRQADERRAMLEQAQTFTATAKKLPTPVAASTQASTISSRVAKIKKIQKLKSLDHVRRHSTRAQSTEVASMYHATTSPKPSIDGDFVHISDPAASLRDDSNIVASSIQQSEVCVSDSFAKDRGNGIPHDIRSPELPDLQRDGSLPRIRTPGREVTCSRSDPRGRLMVAPSSSSDYETDGDISREPGAFLSSDRNLEELALSGTSASQMTPDVAEFFGSSGHNELQQLKLAPLKDDDDDRTFDYGSREDNEHDTEDAVRQGSLTYSQKREEEDCERQAKEGDVTAVASDMEGSLVQKGDLEHYRKSLDTPIAKTAAVVAGAAAVGCIVMGPVGLLVGAAVVGIGVGVMQIPDEQRSNMRQKATEAIEGMQDSAANASEILSNSCANTYRESGIDDHVPTEVKNFCNGTESDATELHLPANEEDVLLTKEYIDKNPSKEYPSIAPKSRVPPSLPYAVPKQRDKKQIVACLRDGKWSIQRWSKLVRLIGTGILQSLFSSDAITPVAQIYSLPLAEQPIAWLDVLACAYTLSDEKVEAMEEILILAKDKHRARIFLEEGILDPIIWILDRYLEKKNVDSTPSHWANPDISEDEEAAAKLAAMCCLTLGKAHCAANHTEGDLLLMSLYERGTVPEERQLAQMLHEVPHHARVSTSNDPTVITPGSEIFAQKRLSLPQAEEMANVVKRLADLHKPAV